MNLDPGSFEPLNPESIPFISSADDLSAFLDSLPGGDEPCAIDSEADSLHAYREKLCLIQFSAGDRHALIDPLVLDRPEVDILLRYLDGRDVWMHGMDFDLSILKRTYDWIPARTFDTQIAARLIGCRQFGLAHLIEEYFDVKLSKASQRANWGTRPLSDHLIEYAVNDVRYLLPLAGKLNRQLHEAGRWEWFLESCQGTARTVLERPGPDTENAWRISGTGNMRRVYLAFLRALWHWRDFEARRRDLPPFKILNNRDLISAANAAVDGNDRLPRRMREGMERRYRKAIAQARGFSPEEWPEERKRGKRPPADPEFGKRLNAFKKRRDIAAAELNIDESLIAPRPLLESLAARTEGADERLLSWQRQLLGL